jgi:hypothetical protein
MVRLDECARRWLFFGRSAAQPIDVSEPRAQPTPRGFVYVGAPFMRPRLFGNRARCAESAIVVSVRSRHAEQDFSTF